MYSVICQAAVVFPIAFTPVPAWQSLPWSVNHTSAVIDAGLQDSRLAPGRANAAVPSSPPSLAHWDGTPGSRAAHVGSLHASLAGTGLDAAPRVA